MKDIETDTSKSFVIKDILDVSFQKGSDEHAVGSSIRSSRRRSRIRR